MKDKAIYDLYSNVAYIDGDGDNKKAYDDDGNEVIYDVDDVATEVIRLQAAYDALAYSRNREAEYPTIAELTISLFDAGDKAALVTKRAAVKTKWPKDNSGPVE
jgi:hypothetical protein